MLVAGTVGSGVLGRPVVLSWVEDLIGIWNLFMLTWTMVLLWWWSPEYGSGRSCTILWRTWSLWHRRVLLRVWSLSVWLCRVWCCLGLGWTPGRTPVGCRKGIFPSWSSDGAGATSLVLVRVPPGAFRECRCGLACHRCRSGCSVIPGSTCSISLWKLAGQPSSPKCEVIQWNCPLLGMVNAVRGCDSGSSFLCQNPEVKSSVLKMDELALPMSPCIYWSPSWSTCQCESADWVAGSLERSWVLGLASWVRRILVNCTVSLTGEPLLVLTIRLGSARWIGCVPLLSWIVFGKWVCR